MCETDYDGIYEGRPKPYYGRKLSDYQFRLELNTSLSGICVRRNGDFYSIGPLESSPDGWDDYPFLHQEMSY